MNAVSARAGCWIIAAACCAGVWLYVPVARAGGMYKCQGSNGETAYTGNTSGYHHCQLLARFADAPPPKPVPGQSVYRNLKSDTATAMAEPTVTKRKNAAGGVRISRGTVYKGHWGKDGKTVMYTNVRPHGDYKVLFHYVDTCFACAVHSAIDWATVALNLTAFRSEISTAASEFGVDPSLLRALIHAESGFDPDAKSAKGAQGLTQLMPATAASLNVSDAYDAAQNIRGGARYLAKLLRDFHGNEALATAAYNAGEAAVRKYHGVPPYAETQVYVKRVGLLHRRYRAARLDQPQQLVAGQAGTVTASP